MKHNACENYIAQGNVCCGIYISGPPHYCTESNKSMQVLLTISWVSQLSADHSGIWHIPPVITHCAICVVDTDLHPALSYISTIYQYHITIEACWGTQQRRFHLIFTPFSTPELTQSHNKLLAGIPNTTLYLLQIVPLPKNPWLHVQSKLPSVFKHWAFSSQMLFLGSHSLISEKEVCAAFSTLVSHHSRICNYYSYWPVQLNPVPPTSW